MIGFCPGFSMLLLALGTSVMSASAESEQPSINGQPLSVWLRQVQDQNRDVEHAELVRHGQQHGHGDHSERQVVDQSVPSDAPPKEEQRCDVGRHQGDDDPGGARRPRGPVECPG